MIEVPAGFETDFASVPRVPVAYWLFGDVAHEAAVVHDFLYSTAAVPRETADKVLLEAMEVTGVASWRRMPIYWAVRRFGVAHYQLARKAPAFRPGMDSAESCGLHCFG